MADSPAPDQDAAQARGELVALYAGITVALLAGVSVILAKMVPTPFGKAAALRKLKAFTRQVATSVVARRVPLVNTLMQAEGMAGALEAARQVDAMVTHARVAGPAQAALAARRITSGAPPARPLSTPAPPATPFGAAGGPGDRPASTGSARGDLNVPHGVRAEALIRAELNSALDAAERQIIRIPDDVFAEVAGDAAIQNVIANAITPHEAMAKAWHDFMGQGITGFTDAAGRRWNLATYTEMAVRTASARAYNSALIESLHVEGIDLFTVPPHNDPCPLCTPWENAVLAVSPTPWADATIGEAQAAGLFHPNCRHSLVAWMPGLSPRLPRTVWNEEHQARYDATQKQRQIERALRRAKTQYDYALSTNQKARAGMQIRELQARLRRLLVEHGNLTREAYRERPNLGQR